MAWAHRLHGPLVVLGLLGLAGIHAQALAAEMPADKPAAMAAGACSSFRVDLSAERALFAGEPTPVAAARAAAAAPLIAAGRLYRLQLPEQAAVALVVEPGKRMLPDGAHAGLLRLQLPHAGRYRVAAGGMAWVDAVEGGQRLPTVDFQGMPGCHAPHKYVVFDFATTDALLQVTGSSEPVLELTVVPAPAGAAAP